MPPPPQSEARRGCPGRREAEGRRAADPRDLPTAPSLPIGLHSRRAAPDPGLWLHGDMGLTSINKGIGCLGAKPTERVPSLPVSAPCPWPLPSAFPRRGGWGLEQTRPRKRNVFSRVPKFSRSRSGRGRRGRGVAARGEPSLPPPPPALRPSPLIVDRAVGPLAVPGVPGAVQRRGLRGPSHEGRPPLRGPRHPAAVREPLPLHSRR